MTDPQPGDFGLTTITGYAGVGIDIGERLCGSGAGSQYQHAFLYLGDGQLGEAEPGGFRIADVSEYADRTVRWSSGLVPLTDGQRQLIVAAAKSLVGTPYSWLDYWAIAAHRLHVPAPGLKAYIASTKHQICSVAVDECYQRGGVSLFAGVWPGYVLPSMLGDLLDARGLA